MVDWMGPHRSSPNRNWSM